MSEERLSKAEAIAKADAAWADWRAFLVGEAAAGRAQPRGSDGWTLAEVFAHVTRWQGWAVDRIRGILIAEKAERLDIEGNNAAWAKADRGVAFAPALERMDGAWAELRKAADAVPEARWRRLISVVFAANTWEHYEEHLAWHPAASTRR
jgi:Mycothiol maleylpyruvate isomerase N-terminal domain